MTINLSALSTEELDELLLQAAIERAKRTPEVDTEPPHSALPLIDPTWRTENMEGGVLLLLRHPGYGWLAFVLPNREVITMSSWMMANTMRSALGINPDNTQLTEASSAEPPEGGAGGVRH